jgi:6-phosphogluconolactonase
MNDEPTLLIRPDVGSVAAEAAQRIAAALRAAVATRGRVDWATTGGSSPIEIYRHLIQHPLCDTVPWDDVHVWWGDDRYVPRDHPLSNVKAFDDIVMNLSDAEEGTAGAGSAGVPIPIENLHPFRTGEAIGSGAGPDGAAAELVSEMADQGLATQDGWPVVDLMLLGVGGDGHVLSVFPGSAAFDSSDWALAVPAPTHIEPHVPRVTMHPSTVTVAREVLVVVTGGGKTGVLREVFGDTRDPRRWPAQLARRAGATWLLDEEAAAQLPR